MNGWNSSRAIFLGRPHWCSLQFRADDDDRPGRVIDAFAEQVFAESALLALDHVGERLERAVGRAEHGPFAAVVVEQGVDRLLQHALFVADDDLGGVEIDQLLEPVVAVDDAAIEIVQIAGGEVAAIEQHERPQIGRNDRDALEHHPFGLVLRPPMPLSRRASTTLSRLTRSRCFCLDGFSFWLSARVVAQFLGQLDQIELLEQLLDRLGAHAGLEGRRHRFSRARRYSSSVRSCRSLSGVSPGSMTT